MGWCVDDVMPGRNGPENLRFLKKSQLEVKIGPWKQTVGDSAIDSKSWVFRISTGRDDLRLSWLYNTTAVGYLTLNHIHTYI